MRHFAMHAVAAASKVEVENGMQHSLQLLTLML